MRSRQTVRKNRRYDYWEWNCRYCPLGPMVRTGPRTYARKRGAGGHAHDRATARAQATAHDRATHAG